jgi:hypothetical protein
MGIPVYTPGTVPTQYGWFAHTTKGTDAFTIPAPAGTLGVVVSSAYDGALNTPTLIESYNDIEKYYGAGDHATCMQQAMKGGAASLWVVRAGTGGTAGSLTLDDTAGTPADILTISAKNPGTRTYKVLIRSAANTANKELVVFDDTKILETITFDAGTDNGGEPAKLRTAILATSAHLTAGSVLNSGGNNVVATLASTALTGGAAPTVSGSEWTAALAEFNSVAIDGLITSSESASVHASIEAQLDSWEAIGKRVWAWVAEDEDAITLANRQASAASYGNYKMNYLIAGGGVENGTGTEIEGATMAARLAGELVSSDITDTMTFRTLGGFTSTINALESSTDIDASIQKGGVVIGPDPNGLPMVLAGITTFKASDADDDHDLGWSKQRRVRTRFELYRRIDLAKVGLRVSNTQQGRGAALARVQRVMNDMIAEQALKAPSTVAWNPSDPQTGDTGYLQLTVSDVDSLERVLMEVAFNY